MSTRSRLLLIGAAVVLVAAAVVVWWRFRPGIPVGGGVPAPQGMLDLAKVDHTSPNLGLRVLGLQVVRFADSTGWSWVLSCTEPDGCHARIELVFRYTVPEGERVLRTRRVIHLAPGAQERMGYSNTPGEDVQVVERVDIEVLEVLPPEGQDIDFAG